MATNVWNMEIPKGASNYLKLEEWQVKIRILSQEFIEWYSDRDKEIKKSHKYRKDECPEKSISPDWFVYFRGCVIWNYNAIKKADWTYEWMLQWFEIKSRVIMKKLQALINDADRGPELDYDLKITKAGKEKETKYDVIPSGKWPTDPEILKIYKEADIELESLFEWIDPFNK